MPLSNDPEVQRPVVQRPGRPNRPGGPRLLPWEQWFQASQPAVQAPAPAPAPQQGVNLANWLASLVPAGPSSSPQPAQTAIPTPHLDIQSLMEKNPPKLTGEQAELAQLQGLIPQADFNEIMASAEPPVQADLIPKVAGVARPPTPVATARQVLDAAIAKKKADPEDLAKYQSIVNGVAAPIIQLNNEGKPAIGSFQPGPAQAVDEARIDLATKERAIRERALGTNMQGPVAPNKPQGVGVGDIDQLTWSEYNALPAKQKAAVDFNTMLVDAVNKDRANTDTYKPNPQDQATYDATVQRMFGADHGSEMFAPETLAVLKQIQFKDHTADLDDFIHLNAAITADDLTHLKDIQGPTAYEAKAGPAQLDRYQLTQVLSGNTADFEQKLTDKLAEGNQLLRSVSPEALAARNPLVDRLGGLPAGPTQTGPGYGQDERSVFFRNSFEALAQPQYADQRDKILSAINSQLKPGDYDLFMNYADQRSRDAQLYNIPLSQGEGHFYTADQFREQLGLTGGTSSKPNPTPTPQPQQQPQQPPQQQQTGNGYAY